jgi:hypothetical protein
MSTRDKLISAIVDHYSGLEGKKLNVSAAAKKIGVSRQYVHRVFEDLVPYIKGEKPFTDLAENVAVGGQNEMLEQAFSTIETLKRELASLTSAHKLELRKVTENTYTTLMNGDITFHEADEVRILMEKQALHFQKLVSDKKTLETEIAAIKAKQLSKEVEKHVSSDVTVIKPDLEPIFENFKKTGDVDVFEEEKDVAIESALRKINGLPDNKKIRIVIYIERYLCKLESVVSRIEKSAYEHAVILSLPVHSIVELKLYAKKIADKGLLLVWIPVLDSDVIVKAQRKFHFSHIPEEEFTSADRMSFPRISDGFSEVTQFLVSQGE